MAQLSRLLVLVTLGTWLPLPAHADETPEEKGLAIAKAADERGNGYGDYSASGEMILRDSGGYESRRNFRVATREVQDDGEMSRITFEWPADIKDTALLTIAHKVDEDEQWLYLPALKRVKRISSSGRSGSFVASEFSYEDMIGEAIERYNYRWLGDEPCPVEFERTCHIQERIPVEANSGYSRQVAWLDIEEYRVFKVDYYDRKKSHLKTMTVEGYAQYLDRYWRPAKMSMVNHQTGRSTVMHWRDYEFGKGLKAEDFSTRALERAR